MTPLFPTLLPRLVDPAWFNVDPPFDYEAELEYLENEHESCLANFAVMYNDVVPIGKTLVGPLEEEEEEDDEDDNDDDDESETHDEDEEDEIEMDGPYDANPAPAPPAAVNIRMVQGQQEGQQ